MSQSKQYDNIPGLMLIMRSVAQAAGTTTAEIIDGSRNSALCHARAAVYKIARRYGYAKDEIMYFLDRNRTVAYNFEANLAGHLSTDADFKALCEAAETIMYKHPHRGEKTQQRARNCPQMPIEQTETTTADGRPTFTAWKGRLGWTFTADECRREWHAKRAAAEFMETYGKPSGLSQSRTPTTYKPPRELPTAEAALYLGVGPCTLIKGYQLGRLHRFKKPGGTSFWYYTAELDSYKTFLEQTTKPKHKPNGK